MYPKLALKCSWLLSIWLVMKKVHSGKAVMVAALKLNVSVPNEIMSTNYFEKDLIVEIFFLYD